MLPLIKDVLSGIHKETTKRAILIPCLCMSLSMTLLAAIPNADAAVAKYNLANEVRIKHIPLPSKVTYTMYNPNEGDYHPLDQKSLNRLAMQLAIETEGGSIRAKRLVAQCILDRTEMKSSSNGTVYSTLTWMGQFDYRSNYVIYPEDYEAINWVFSKGNRVTAERITYFCSPSYLRPSVRRWFYSLKQIAAEGGLVFFSADKK